MIKKRIGIVTVMSITVALLSACSSSSGIDSSVNNSAATEAETVTDAADVPESDEPLGYIAEMDKNTVMTFAINADPQEWQSMLDNAADKEYISADITINGTTIENVGIRPKGNSSLSSVARDDTTDRYSFKIKFDEYVDDQTWLGLDKLVLNSNYSDKTSMKEYLSYDIMSYIGVEAPLFAYADIMVNGENWGFYLAVEDYEYSYLNRTADGEGELYKPDSMDMVGADKNGMPAGGDMPEGGNKPDRNMSRTNNGEADTTGKPDLSVNESGRQGGSGGMGADNGVALIYTDDNVESYSSIFDNDKTKTTEADNMRVIEAIKHLNEGTELETYVDVDSVLRYLAAHTTVVNLDSYSGSFGHNYILYENKGQITMLPWDYNMAFGGFHSSNASDVVNFPIDTPVSGVSMEDRPLISKLLEVAEYQERYHQYLQEIIDGYFADGKFEQKVDEINTMIADYMEQDTHAFYSYEEYQAAAAELKKLGTLRGESIQGQLTGSISSTADGQTAEPDKMVDASTVDLSLLGDEMGGSGGPGGKFSAPGMGGPGGSADGSGGGMDDRGLGSPGGSREKRQ